jgi:hypothetical protein
MREFEENVVSLELKKQETFDIIRHNESKLSAVQDKMKRLRLRKKNSRMLGGSRWVKLQNTQMKLFD